MPSAIPYEEPPLIRLLVLSSFIYLLNVVRVSADFLFHGGVIAEIALGIIYGSPLAALLPAQWEETFTALGYIGLVLVVFEGGLSSNLPTLLSNLPLSTVCALVGIAMPIALSFALLNAGFGYTPLEAFAAGAALSSTSLGTTLAALNSVVHDPTTASPSDPATEAANTSLPVTRSPSLARDPSTSTVGSLQQSRIGTVLISAAIIDDVVGLVIAAVIPALASAQSETSQTSRGNLAWTIIRPLLSSLLIAAIAPLVSRFVLRPLFWYRGWGERWCAPARVDKPWGAHMLARLGGTWGSQRHADAIKLFLMVGVLSAMAAISYYTGTSILYGTYMAGLILTYISKPRPSSGSSSEYESNHAREHQRGDDLSFETAFSRTIGPIQEHVLLPLFFASIGFAIPFLDLWDPQIIWRGVIYSILMCIAKLAVGLPILFHEPSQRAATYLIRRARSSITALIRTGSAIRFTYLRRSTQGSSSRNSTSTPESKDGAKTRACVSVSPTADNNASGPANPQQPLLASVPAATFMGIAMVARGEIGLLIAQLARGDDTNDKPGLLGTESFLLCIWAILLCTLVGPVSLGFVVRKWGAQITAGRWA
ncbi:hypothetical protein C8Q77DRAFT_1086796 [Trametes polyzona]|nr:hypothetical protein C8Q77DRAFT_1086796 [Trametes polyzona]